LAENSAKGGRVLAGNCAPAWNQEMQCLVEDPDKQVGAVVEGSSNLEVL
jgi:hypothetical protein